MVLVNKVINKWPYLYINSIQDCGWGKKTRLTSFSPVTSTNVGISP